MGEGSVPDRRAPAVREGTLACVRRDGDRSHRPLCRCAANPAAVLLRDRGRVTLFGRRALEAAVVEPRPAKARCAGSAHRA